MKITIDDLSQNFAPSQTFALKVSGVTHFNKDGTNRQDLLKKCKAGQKVKLVREPDNPYDKFAIAVFTEEGQQIGYLPKGDVKLAIHIDRGGRVKANIKTITGGPGLLASFLPSKRKSYGCVLKITKEDFDWNVVSPWMEADRKAKDLINKAKSKENSEPERAVKLYQEAISVLKELDSQGQQAVAWRTTRYPVNRLTLTLERMGKIDEALEEIKKYEMIEDPVGLDKTDTESLKKRQNRIAKKRGQ